MSALTDLRTARAEAEALYQRTMQDLDESLPGLPLESLLCEALGYHREVCALYAAEISLISDGRINSINSLPNNTPTL